MQLIIIWGSMTFDIYTYVATYVIHDMDVIMCSHDTHFIVSFI